MWMLPVVIVALAASSVSLLLSPAAAQDTAAGQRVFNQCRACHAVEQGGRNGVGLNLHGVFGHRAAALEGIRYPAPMREKAEAGLVWTEKSLRPYLRNPGEVVPGPAMASVRHLRAGGRLCAKLAGASHIVPVDIGDTALCREVAGRLLEEFAIYATPINYPTAPRGQERLRLCATPFHTDAMIAGLVAALRAVLPAPGMRAA